jgi:hypothetical protein
MQFTGCKLLIRPPVTVRHKRAGIHPESFRDEIHRRFTIIYKNQRFLQTICSFKETDL